MLKVKDGHLSELSVLFERYQVKLYNFFLRLTMDKTSGEDLTQNLFYRIILYRSSFQPANGNFRSWIYRMARNVHVDFYRQKQKTGENPKGQELENMDMPDEEEVFTEEHYEQLNLAMAKLTPDQREIILMSRYQGLKYEEISRIREISVSAVKVQVHRAIKQLRTIYFRQS